MASTSLKRPCFYNFEKVNGFLRWCLDNGFLRWSSDFLLTFPSYSSFFVFLHFLLLLHYLILPLAQAMKKSNVFRGDSSPSSPSPPSAPSSSSSPSSPPSAPSSSSSPSSPPVSSSSSAHAMKKYDVFISFRGEDTRDNFTSNLHGKLREHGVEVFIDDELKRGDEISSSLMNAIEESTISIVLISRAYPSSRWCLEELVKIIECKKTYTQIVLPVFYLVDPSHVRNQTGEFGTAFVELVNGFKEKVKQQMTEEEIIAKVQTWRNALTEAANLAGYTNQNTSEYKLAKKIVGDILEILDKNSSYSLVDNKNLVGAQPTINYIIGHLLRLDDESRDVRIIGIWGMGGIGKTTLAEAVFNKIRNKFEASYFALNVREKSSSSITFFHLQRELLSSITGGQCSEIISPFYKQRFHRKKVIIVFDDVASHGEIERLVGDLNHFRSGSRIIITTRDKQVLRACGVDERDILENGGLSQSSALQLFSWYAFGQNHPEIDYDDLAKRVVKYTNGVPLALKVLGLHLLKRSKIFWESAMKKLEIIPHKDIQKVLRISYDELEDNEQNIFLDIACFFKWENVDFVKEFLHACGFFLSGIDLLLDKCLISISIDNKITMHDLLQEMGWEVVRQESTSNPGNRSRLWYHEDIYSALDVKKGSDAIQGICLDMSKREERLNLQCDALASMHKLRLFKLHNSRDTEVTEAIEEIYLDRFEHTKIMKIIRECELRAGVNNINRIRASQGLRYLCWHGCPLRSLVSNFNPNNLIALDMPHSRIEELWPNTQLFNLKYIDLNHSTRLRICDLSLAPNLERLNLEGCTSLLKIFSPVSQSLDKLVILNLRLCKSLLSFQTGTWLESLKKLAFSDCSNPMISLVNLSRLVIWNLKNCAMLRKSPSNICSLKSLEHLNLSGCSKLDGLPDNLANLGALKELNLTDCFIKELPDNLSQLSSLERLFLAKNNFESIPTSIIDLSKLRYLDLGYCERLQSLPKLPSQLESIDAHNCTLLEASSWLTSLFSSKSPPQRVRANFSNCFKLDQNRLIAIVKDSLQKIPRSIACICFPASEIPDWITHRSTGSVLHLEPCFSYSWDDSLIICAVVEFRKYYNLIDLAVVYEIKFCSGDGPHGQVEHSYFGTWMGWDCGTSRVHVDEHHLFLGSADFPSEFYDSLQRGIDNGSIHGRMTINFRVENLKLKSAHRCTVTNCGVWSPLTLI